MNNNLFDALAMSSSSLPAILDEDLASHSDEFQLIIDALPPARSWKTAYNAFARVYNQRSQTHRLPEVTTGEKGVMQFYKITPNTLSALEKRLGGITFKFRKTWEISAIDNAEELDESTQFPTQIWNRRQVVSDTLGHQEEVVETAEQKMKKEHVYNLFRTYFINCCLPEEQILLEDLRELAINDKDEIPRSQYYSAVLNTAIIDFNYTRNLEKNISPETRLASSIL